MVLTTQCLCQDKLYDKSEPKGLKVIGVSLNKSRDAWVKAINMNFPGSTCKISNIGIVKLLMFTVSFPFPKPS